MDRETKEITAGNHTYTVKTYATAREANAIQQAYMKGMKVEVVGELPKISEFNPGAQFEVEQEMVRQLIVSMDGVPDAVLDRCIDLPNDQFGDLIAQLDELVSKKKR